MALEGYYDDQIWHRFVSDFIIQSGDPTGTGLGGESFYGQEFADEFHQRLRFNRRGLLGMANGGERNTNGSQFFLTLGNTPELQGKHTMFGRIHNNTIYNLIALAESVGEVGEDDRPLYPPKLRTIRVIENPFEGQIQLRITREEKQAAKKNKKEHLTSDKEIEAKKKKLTAITSTLLGVTDKDVANLIKKQELATSKTLTRLTDLNRKLTTKKEKKINYHYCYYYYYYYYY